jgi:hypothetical protein
MKQAGKEGRSENTADKLGYLPVLVGFTWLRFLRGIQCGEVRLPEDSNRIRAEHATPGAHQRHKPLADPNSSNTAILRVALDGGLCMALVSALGLLRWSDVLGMRNKFFRVLCSESALSAEEYRGFTWLLKWQPILEERSHGWIRSFFVARLYYPLLEPIPNSVHTKTCQCQHSQ